MCAFQELLQHTTTPCWNSAQMSLPQAVCSAPVSFGLYSGRQQWQFLRTELTAVVCPNGAKMSLCRAGRLCAGSFWPCLDRQQWCILKTLRMLCCFLPERANNLGGGKYPRRVAWISHAVVHFARHHSPPPMPILPTPHMDLPAGLIMISPRYLICDVLVTYEAKVNFWQVSSNIARSTKLSRT